MIDTHQWVLCEYCNGTGNNNGSITGGCFFCCHPMIQDRKPGFRFLRII